MDVDDLERIFNLASMDEVDRGALVFRGPSDWPGEKYLLLSILEAALGDVLKATPEKRRASRHVRRAYQEARAWIASDADGWLTSYLRICELLGIDPEYLRNRIDRAARRRRKYPRIHHGGGHRHQPTVPRPQRERAQLRAA